MTNKNKTLLELLKENGYDQYIGHDGTILNNAVGDIIDLYDDEPGSLLDYETSDWVNLDEPYTHDLVKRYDLQAHDIDNLVDDYLFMTGMTIRELMASSDIIIENPYDFITFYVNLGMTHAAQELMRAAFPEEV